ncbi:uncharacterized protein LOC132063073 [Lycium ferocissimum]|uniref:uncharacterized protein LOC132063073 n=1 Tax=Lycium ferocissimum TaxID=112874 RepID=UPI00281688BC|nr:uncharacterized protein LOC132063073 [Lycium ferocissimum]
MTEEVNNLGNDDHQGLLTERDSGSPEEVRRLKQQLAHVYQAWMTGQPPPPLPQGFSEGIPTIPVSTQAPPVETSDPLCPPGFFPAYNLPNIAGTSTVRPPAGPPRNTPLVVPAATVYTIPQPSPAVRPHHEPQPNVYEGQYYSPEMIFRAPGPYNHATQYDSPIENDKLNRMGEQDEISRKVKSLEQALRNMQGTGGPMNVSYKHLCLFPDIQLPAGFKMPKFELYNGHGDPVAHLRGYCSKMRGAGGKNELLMAYFSQSLSGSASEWYTRQDASKWYTWDDMAQAFVRQFQYNIDIVPDRVSLTKMTKKPNETFCEYGIRWREQLARVNPPMQESEMVDYFLQAQDPTYFSYLITAMGRPFNEVVKMGEMVEEGIKSGRILSYSALKATTQAIQNSSGNFRIKKEKDDIAMVAQGPRQGPRGSSYQYTQNYSQAPPQRYYPVQDPQYFADPPQYVVYNTQSYDRPSTYRQWRAPHQNPRHPPQNFQAPYNPRPRQEYGGEQRPRDNFTPIGESYASLFEKLKHLNMIGTIPQNYADPRAKGFNPTARCAYHSDAPGHSTEDCRTLKREVEKMIQAKMIVIQDSDTPNITENPLPAHNDTHFVGMICDDKEYREFSKSFSKSVAESPIVTLDPDMNEGLVKRVKNPFVEEKTTEIGGGSVDSDMQSG